MCGVLGRARVFSRRRQGSSPRVRGFVSTRHLFRKSRGFIPACAGFCVFLDRGGRFGWVHPRVCGVLGLAGVRYVLFKGSSPRVRGFERPSKAWCVLLRFIPACAGFCSQTPVHKTASRVHPRVCGVLFVEPVPPALITGSSPRVRGFVRFYEKKYGIERFIPACAGFWRDGQNFLLVHKVHPRVCGVLLASEAPGYSWLGSSPRVRGFAKTRHGDMMTRRFIPACAGFCRSGRASAMEAWVHPRVCGVLFVGHSRRSP